MLVVTLALRSAPNPTVTSLVETRLLADGAKGLASLDGHYLASLAHGFHALRAGTPALWAAIVDRAVQLGELGTADHANLASALSGAGVAMPFGVRCVPDPA